jgi:NADH-quinone oxidoreductase subunit H
MDKQTDPTARDSAPHAAPPAEAGMKLPTPAVATPAARLASKDYGSYAPPVQEYRRWLVGTVLGWAAFLGVLVVAAGVLLLIVRGMAGLFGDPVDGHGVGEAIGNIISLILLLVMVTATLLTMADRKWSALMQDRVGPNRARLPIPGLRDRPLKGIPHILADVLKMLFKEDFIPERALSNRLLFNLGPLLAFGPAFCLFAVVPVSGDMVFLGKRMSLQVAHVDWGILYVFALASMAVFGTALAGWSSNNKLALLGGLRASAQLVSYEVTLGLTLAGAMIAFGTVRLEEMTAQQGDVLFGFLPSWGMVYQPVGLVLFMVAALAEIKRAPFDTPEGESEIIGYFLEYSGLKSGLFLIAEYAETVVISGIIVAIFLGGYHIPWVEPWLTRSIGVELTAVLQVTSFIIKLLFVIWVQFLIRWSFPRFRYDQIMRLGWKMMLPVSLANVAVSAGVYLAGGRDALALVGVAEWIGILAFVALSARPKEEAAPAAHH